jgi:hypothetical protein
MASPRFWGPAGAAAGGGIAFAFIGNRDPPDVPPGITIKLQGHKYFLIYGYRFSFLGNSPASPRAAAPAPTPLTSPHAPSA